MHILLKSHLSSSYIHSAINYINSKYDMIFQYSIIYEHSLQILSCGLNQKVAASIKINEY